MQVKFCCRLTLGWIWWFIEEGAFAYGSSLLLWIFFTFMDLTPLLRSHFSSQQSWLHMGPTWSNSNGGCSGGGERILLPVSFHQCKKRRMGAILPPFPPPLQPPDPHGGAKTMGINFHGAKNGFWGEEPTGKFTILVQSLQSPFSGPSLLILPLLCILLKLWWPKWNTIRQVRSNQNTAKWCYLFMWSGCYTSTEAAQNHIPCNSL